MILILQIMKPRVSMSVGTRGIRQGTRASITTAMRGRGLVACTIAAETRSAKLRMLHVSDVKACNAKLRERGGGGLSTCDLPSVRCANTVGEMHVDGRVDGTLGKESPFAVGARRGGPG